MMIINLDNLKPEKLNIYIQCSIKYCPTKSLLTCAYMCWQAMLKEYVGVT